MDLSWFITMALGAIVIYLVYYVATMNTRYWKIRDVPYIYTPPVLGTLYDTIIRRKGFSQLITEIYDKFEGERFGGFFQMMTPMIMLRDPELINHVLIKDFVHFEDRVWSWKRASDLFSLGLGNLTGEEWRTARHKLTPTFTSGKLKMMFNPISECSDNVVLHLKSKLDQDINVKELSLKYIVNVIANVAFGLQIDTLKDCKDNEFYRVSSRFFAPSVTFLLKMTVAMFMPKIRDLFNINLLDEDIDMFFRRITTDIIKHRESTGTRRNDFLQLMLDQRTKERNQLQNRYTDKIPEEQTEDPDDKELLEHLKNTPHGNKDGKYTTEIFTDEFIAAQTFLFISGGSETTATVLSFVYYELAVNHEYQKRVQKEVDDVLSNNEFNYQAIKKMTYMEQFLHETMRCHPILAALQRLSSTTYKIPGSDVVLEKETAIVIPVASLHKDPQYFADPEIFNPDRFEDMNAIPKGVYQGFGDGPRMCIAMRLAMLEMKIFLAKIISNYDVILSEKTKLPLTPLKNSILLNVEGGVWVKFRKRSV